MRAGIFGSAHVVAGTPGAIIYQQGFEDGTDSWEPLVNCTLGQQTVRPHTGLASLRTSVAGSTGTVSAKRDIGGFIPGRRYKATVWVSVNHAQVSAGRIEVTGIGAASPVSPLNMDSPSTIQLEYTFTATSSTHEVVLAVNSAGTASRQANWDDIEIVEV